MNGMLPPFFGTSGIGSRRSGEPGESRKHFAHGSHKKWDGIVG